MAGIAKIMMLFIAVSLFAASVCAVIKAARYRKENRKDEAKECLEHLIIYMLFEMLMAVPALMLV